jgi:hypothetical protein
MGLGTQFVSTLAACREAGKFTATLAGEILRDFWPRAVIGGHFMASFVESGRR